MYAPVDQDDNLEQMAPIKRQPSSDEEDDKPRYPFVSDRLRTIRDRVKWTQETVSERSEELSRIEVNNAECGRSACTTVRIVRGLAKAYGYSTDDLDDYLRGRIDLAELDRRALERSTDPGTIIATDTRYPDRAKALTTPLASLLPAEVVEALRTMRIAENVHHDAFWWAERALRLYRDWQDGTGVFGPEEP